MSVTTASAPKTDASAPFVVDLGKHRRKAIKQLRRGEGPLMDEIRGCIDELRASGTISASATPVVVIVRQKRRRRSGLFPGF